MTREEAIKDIKENICEGICCCDSKMLCGCENGCGIPVAIEALEIIDKFGLDADGYSTIREAIGVAKNALKESDELFYKLVGVMHFVDKFLEGDELKIDEVQRADLMREKVLKQFDELKKYRKHDLRKNPNDLPLDYKRVLICLKGFESNPSGVLIAIHSRISKKWETETFTYDDDDIVAWREIEPFEGGEE